MAEDNLLVILKLTVALVLAVPLFFIIHIIISWTFRFAKIKITPLVGNLLSIIIGSISIIIYGVLLLGSKLWETPLEALAYFIFVFLTLTGFAYMDFATFAISEVSLHIHSMLIILIFKKLSIDAIKIQYNKSHMLKERLERLIDIRQIREKDNHYYLNGRLLLYGSRIFDIWKILLGFSRKLNIQRREQIQ